MTKHLIIRNTARAVLAVAVLAAGSRAMAQQTCAVLDIANPKKCLCPLGEIIPPSTTFTFYQSGSCNIANGPGVVQPLLPGLQPRFAWDLPVPVFHVPDKTTFPGTDYYVIGMKEVTQLPVAFPQPATPAPVDTQWLGLCSTAVGAFVPATATTPASCSIPWFTPVWGYAQENGGAIQHLATYPSMSFLAKKGTPVKVQWQNNLKSSNHLYCPHPQNSNWPCSIDRTLMGTLFDPLKDTAGVNPFGTKMQPDNAMVVHLHGGEIPPDSDGFAELWIGNGGAGGTAAAYGPGGAFFTTPYAQSNVAGGTANIEPPLLPPAGNGIPSDATYATLNADPAGSLLASVYQPSPLQRPLTNSIFYNYPMVQNAATIWYHDHALGKTRINVMAGPAGYFYVQDPGLDNYADPANGIPAGSMFTTGLLPDPGDCSNLGILTGKCFDIPIVFQDRAFNMPNTNPACAGPGADPACRGPNVAEINFPNGLGQPVIPGVVLNSLAPGVNPGVHPQWVPEYFGDSAVVNGVIWPKLKVEPRPYRFRLLDGSNARCYTLNLKVPGALVQPQFIAIGSDQGYLPNAASVKRLDMCPGERYDVVVDFSAFAGQSMFIENTAAAPFPNGVKATNGTPFAFLAQLVRFDVALAPAAGSPPVVPYVLPKALKAVTPPALTLMPPTAPAGSRQLVLNEVLDAVTLGPLRVQIDGKHFEDAITETPKRGTTEVWTFINTTGDAHPIHLHLVQFQVVGRQKFNAIDYTRQTGFAVPGNSVFTKLAVDTFLVGNPKPPLAQELGFKDTVITYPGEITTVVAKWDGGWADCPPGATLNGSPGPYNPALPVCGKPAAVGAPFWEPVTSGPFVWHCHIVDHEDNEMMRPSLVIP